MIEITFTVAVLDASDDFARAAANLADAVSRPGGQPVSLVDDWIKGSITVLEQAIAEGDVLRERTRRSLAQVLVSH